MDREKAITALLRGELTNPLHIRLAMKGAQASLDGQADRLLRIMANAGNQKTANDIMQVCYTWHQQVEKFAHDEKKLSKPVAVPLSILGIVGLLATFGVACANMRKARAILEAPPVQGMVS